MKTIASVLLSVLVAGCSYGSKLEAENACSEWADKGIKYKVWAPYTPGAVRKYTLNSRTCEHEYETKKILGLENSEIEDGKDYNDQSQVPGNPKVTKRFQY